MGKLGAAFGWPKITLFAMCIVPAREKTAANLRTMARAGECARLGFARQVNLVAGNIASELLVEHVEFARPQSHFHHPQIMSKHTNVNRGPDGWVVRIVRDGVEYSRYFRFSDGGVRKSLQMAVKHRDEKIRELGERRWKKGPRKKAINNSSGVTGVSKNVFGRWVATWQEDGRQRFKTFKMKREAVAHRKEMTGQA